MSLFLKFDHAAQPTKNFIMNRHEAQSCMNIPCVPQILCDLWTQLPNIVMLLPHSHTSGIFNAPAFPEVALSGNGFLQ